MMSPNLTFFFIWTNKSLVSVRCIRWLTALVNALLVSDWNSRAFDKLFIIIISSRITLVRVTSDSCLVVIFTLHAIRIDITVTATTKTKGIYLSFVLLGWNNFSWLFTELRSRYQWILPCTNHRHSRNAKLCFRPRFLPDTFSKFAQLVWHLVPA